MNLASLVAPDALIGLLTLTALEIVLGIDNIIFVSIIAGRLPHDQQEKGRKVGLVMALLLRILLLLLLGIILRLQAPIVFGLSGQDFVLIGGGLFLITKSVKEIHHKLEEDEESVNVTGENTFHAVIVQIMLMNLVFSIDSIVTAIGMVKNVTIMILAVVLSTFFMIGFSGTVGRFVERHPTIKMLALSFLLLIGGNLIAEGFHAEIPKGYTYFAMGFAIFVEVLNLKVGRNSKTPVHLRNTPALEEEPTNEEIKNG